MNDPAPVRPVAAADLPALLALNNAHATELSPLDAGRLARLASIAFRALTIPPAAALLIAFDQDAAYDSPNFLWWRARAARFVYVDRVVVAPEARGRGHARTLYAALFAAAAQAGHDLVTCEVNSDPPNPVSDAFHAALGFTVAGAARHGAAKAVRYLRRELATAELSKAELPAGELPWRGSCV